MGTSPKDLAATLCNIVGVPAGKYEPVLRKSPFCYKCVHRLIDAHLLTVKINLIGSKLTAIKVEVQSDLKRVVHPGGNEDEAEEVDVETKFQSLRRTLIGSKTEGGIVEMDLHSSRFACLVFRFVNLNNA